MINKTSWPVPPIFRIIQEKGHIPPEEMFRTFNNGIGLVLAVPPEHKTDVLLRLHGLQEEAYVIGDIIARKEDTPPAVFV